MLKKPGGLILMDCNAIYTVLVGDLTLRSYMLMYSLILWSEKFNVICP